MKLKNYRHVHCIGAGGIGISAVMKFLFVQGISVSGSDVKESIITRDLTDLGITVVIGQNGVNIPVDTDLVVYTEAAAQENVERIEATSRGIPQMGHFDFLGELSKDYRTICITGTNGKSTTTAMTGQIFLDAGLDPTVFVGSLVPGWKYGNVAVGKSDILIIEGDEYKRKMLALHPETTAITNIELDHADIYKNISDLESAFHQLGEQTSGTIFISTDIWLRDVMCGMKTVNYDTAFVRDGFHRHGIRHRDRRIQDGQQIFDEKKSLGFWFKKGSGAPTISLRIPGEFNMMNALVAKAVAEEYKISLPIILDSLARFPGIWRRFERVGNYFLSPTADSLLPTQLLATPSNHPIPIISDYGHHPTAIRGTLQGAREFFPNNRLVLLFEPHQHNRTKELFADFAQAFGGADVLILSEIYGVLGRTEEHDASVTSKTLLNAAMQSSTPPKEGHYAANLVDAERLLRFIIREGDVVIVMGAGDVDVVARNLVDLP